MDIGEFLAMVLDKHHEEIWPPEEDDFCGDFAEEHESLPLSDGCVPSALVDK